MRGEVEIRAPREFRVRGSRRGVGDLVEPSGNSSTAIPTPWPSPHHTRAIRMAETSTMPKQVLAALSTVTAAPLGESTCICRPRCFHIRFRQSVGGLLHAELQRRAAPSRARSACTGKESPIRHLPLRGRKLSSETWSVLQMAPCIANDSCCSMCVIYAGHFDIPASTISIIFFRASSSPSAW